MNRNQPLGLPRGSVRALLALALVGACIALAITGKISGTDLLQLAAVAVAFYFAGKTGEQGNGG